MTTRALVVFTDNAGLWWLRLLKPGFRHCFVALDLPGGWLVIEPMSHCTMVTSLPVAEGFDLARWYRDAGLVVVEDRVIEPPCRPAPWRPYSCVESVKRILGIQAAGVLTPWQLYNFLCGNRKKDLDGAALRGYNPSHQHQNCVRFPPPSRVRRLFCIGKRNKKGTVAAKEPVMGGFFSSPSPQMPAPPPMPALSDPEEEARKLRLDTIARNRRGRQGMIATSERGLLDQATGTGKTLLGE